MVDPSLMSIIDEFLQCDEDYSNQQQPSQSFFFDAATKRQNSTELLQEALSHINNGAIGSPGASSSSVASEIDVDDLLLEDLVGIQAELNDENSTATASGNCSSDLSGHVGNNFSNATRNTPIPLHGNIADKRRSSQHGSKEFLIAQGGVQPPQLELHGVTAGLATTNNTYRFPASFQFTRSGQTNNLVLSNSFPSTTTTGDAPAIDFAINENNEISSYMDCMKQLTVDEDSDNSPVTLSKTMFPENHMTISDDLFEKFNLRRRKSSDFKALNIADVNGILASLANNYNNNIYQDGGASSEPGRNEYSSFFDVSQQQHRSISGCNGEEVVEMDVENCFSIPSTSSSSLNPAVSITRNGCLQEEVCESYHQTYFSAGLNANTECLTLPSSEIYGGGTKTNSSYKREENQQEDDNLEEIVISIMKEISGEPSMKYPDFRHHQPTASNIPSGREYRNDSGGLTLKTTRKRRSSIESDGSTVVGAGEDCQQQNEATGDQQQGSVCMNAAEALISLQTSPSKKKKKVVSSSDESSGESDNAVNNPDDEANSALHAARTAADKKSIRKTKNNHASRVHRAKKRKRNDDLFEREIELEKSNAQLKIQLETMQKEAEFLKELLLVKVAATAT